MTLHDVDRLCNYWIRHPPTHELVAGFIGYEAPDEGSRDYSALVAMFPGGKIR